MTASNPITDCQFCSVVSKANGEDPIGTAKATDTWIIVELPLPWTKESLMSHAALKPLFQAVRGGNTKLTPMAIAPDRKYSVPEHAHVFYYCRPATAFAQFDKQEFLVPEQHLEQLIIALLQPQDALHHLEKYIQPTQHVREMMVCTHGNIDVACARFGYPIYKQLRQEFATEFGADAHPLRVWRCSHFGGHQFAPTLVDLPSGQIWGHLEVEMLPALVLRNCPVIKLRPFYRGWAGLTKFEQIVEREIWLQQGWDWLSYHKSGQVLAQDTANDGWDADWADIRLNFAAPHSNLTGAYEARVEVCGSVLTAWNSGEEPIAVKQYQVSQCSRVL